MVFLTKGLLFSALQNPGNIEIPCTPPIFMDTKLLKEGTFSFPPPHSTFIPAWGGEVSGMHGWILFHFISKNKQLFLTSWTNKRYLLLHEVEKQMFNLKKVTLSRDLFQFFLLWIEFNSRRPFAEIKSNVNIWNFGTWGPNTISHNLPSAQFFSS